MKKPAKRDLKNKIQLDKSCFHIGNHVFEELKSYGKADYIH